jgi:hypothetical protein
MKKDLFTPLGNMYIMMHDAQIHNTRTNLAYKIKPKSRRTLQASHSIMHQGPLLWINLPQYIYLDKNRLVTVHAFVSRSKRMILGAYGNGPFHRPLS